MDNSFHDELIRQAVEAAREGDREAARDLLRQVLEEDEENIRAWLLLARLSENPDERRMALATVLQLDPGNTRAQEMLDKLDARYAKSAEDEEVAPGITRRTLQIVLGIAGGIVLLIVLIVFAITSLQGDREAAREAEIAQAATDLAGAELTQTQSVLDLTATADAIQLTQFAQVSPTPTISPTTDRPTLPPSFTPPPTESDEVESLPPPEGIPGRIYGWSGRDLSNRDALPIGLFPLAGGGFQPFSDDLIGRQVSASLDGALVTFTRVIPANSQINIALMNPQGDLVRDILVGVGRYEPFLESYMPFISNDGQRITFIANASFSTLTDEVYILDLPTQAQIVQQAELVAESTAEANPGGLQSTPTGPSPIRRITDDEANYSYPAFSPDETQIVAVQENAVGEVDLVIIDVASGTVTPLTTNGNDVIETTPRWSPAGDLIAYAVELGRDQHDIYLIPPGAPDSGFALIENDADDILPVFSPDGNYLAYSSDRFSRYDLFIYDLTSQDTYQLTSTDDEEYPGDWVN